MKKNNRLHYISVTTKLGLIVAIMAVGAVFVLNQSTALAFTPQQSVVLTAKYTDTIKTTDPGQQATGNKCGGVDSQGKDLSVETRINIGCKGQGNPILDATFAILRFMTLGAGLVMVGSIVVAGIQYTTSRGDPQATAKAIGRITSTLGALALLIFAYALLNWLVPGGAFN